MVGAASAACSGGSCDATGLPSEPAQGGTCGHSPGRRAPALAVAGDAPQPARPEAAERDMIGGVASV